MVDRLKRMRQELEPNWDEVREMRVLSRLMGEIEAERTTRDLPSAPPRRWLRWASAAALVAVAAGVVLVMRWADDLNNRSSLAQSKAQADTSAQSSSELRFSEETVAWLESGAKVQTLEQSAGVIELGQTSGAVRYEVDPARGYLFRVRVDQLIIEVVGTAFRVVVHPDAVDVSVSRGEVNVIDANRVVRLLPGENAHLARSKATAATTQSATAPPIEAEANDAPTKANESAATLLGRSDVARKRQSWAEAEQLLRRVVIEHPRDPQVPTAWFLLGKVRKETGRHQEAAADFARVQRMAPGSSLAEDALYEEAVALQRSGDATGAAAKAQMYLSRYPNGPHAARLDKLRSE